MLFSIFRSFILAASSFSSIPLLTIGVVFRSQCPVEKWISRFLIVLGVINGIECINSLLYILISTFRLLKKSDLFIFITNILSQFAWMRFGAEWVSGVQSYVQFDNVTDKNYCHWILYEIASEMINWICPIISMTVCSVFTIQFLPLIFSRN